MKKLYFLLLGLFALCGLNTAQAKLVVTDTTEFYTDLSQIQEGDSLMFFCYGQGDSGTQKQHRRAWLYNNWRADNPSPQLSENFKVGDKDSRSYVWIINTLADNGDGTIAVTLKALTDEDKFMTGFTIDESSQWGRWNSDAMFTEDEAEATEFTIEKINNDDLASCNDGSFLETDLEQETTRFIYITDPNTQGRFNGQDDPDGDGVHNFVGWNEGLNCFYMFKRAHVTEIPTTNGIIYPVDEGGNEILDESTTEDEYLAGDTITAPTYEHYTYTGVAYDEEETQLETPYYVVTDDDVELGEVYIRFVYAKDPQITFAVVDEEGNALVDADGNQRVENFERYYTVGDIFEAPTISALKLGYEFVSATDSETGEDFLGHEITSADDSKLINLAYRANNTAGLPFIPTTVTDGQFASDTHFYQMTVRGSYYVYSNPAAAEAMGGDYAKLATASGLNTDSIENSVWAFVGNLDDGFQIYNYAEGATKKLCVVSGEDGTAAQLVTEEEFAEIDVNATGSYTFNLKTNSNGGYNFVYRDADNNSSNACLNHYGQKSDLKFWADDAALSDAGSNFLFYEADFDSLTTVKFTTAQAYLNAEGAVSGWTSETLATLKAAVAAKDIDAANAAIEVLAASTDTIAFDINKTYKLTSAYKGFITTQPGVTYAMYAENDSVKWGADSDADTYQWIFSVANDSAYYVSNLGAERTIASYRYNSQAVLFNGTVAADTAKNITVQVGDRAPFVLAKSTVVPGAYRLAHWYGPSLVTLCIKQGMGGEDLTGGAICTYNGDIADRGNTWHLVPVGDVPTGINAATIVTSDTQNNVIYDLSGRRVNNAQRGIYIINGKKVIVK